MGQTIATDAELLAASRRGEREAFGALVERYQPAVCAVTFSRTRDETLAEDVAQDTFIAAWQSLDRVREPNRLGSWLCGIARNLARKARRRREREVPVVEETLLGTDNPFDAASDAETARIVGDALGRVPETYRDVLVLYYREQRSATEIAILLEISEANVLQRLARGRAILTAGVESLVDEALRRQRSRKAFVAGVLAALPQIVPSRADASPVSHGGNMLKISLAALALAGAGAATTAAVVHSKSSSPSTPAVAAAVVAAPVAAPVTPSSVAPTPATKPPKPVLGAPSAAPEADEAATPRLTTQQLAQLGLDHGPTRGPATAPVTIVMFTDPQCTYCGKAYGTIDQLLEEYPTQVRLVVKELPIKHGSQLAAEAAYAADAQGRFWEMHDLMYAHEDDLSEQNLIALAGQAHLDVTAFTTALHAHTFETAVEADKQAAAVAEIQATPSFVINGEKVTGALPIEALRSSIDQALAN